ncbi:hypothetical protein ADL22_29985 [Streptomyces sp. NRRL F-4489]|nr:hypothetical protein ADL22_29985 [Streptomyces sp. NRRL F-4489]
MIRRPVLAAAAVVLAGAASVVTGAPPAHAAGYDYVCDDFDFLGGEAFLHGHGCQAYPVNHEPSGVLFRYRGDRHYSFECLTAHPLPEDATEVFGVGCDRL